MFTLDGLVIHTVVRKLDPKAILKEKINFQDNIYLYLVILDADIIYSIDFNPTFRTASIISYSLVLDRDLLNI